MSKELISAVQALETETAAGYPMSSGSVTAAINTLAAAIGFLLAQTGVNEVHVADAQSQQPQTEQA